ncbi:MAG: methyl-accepting chemotaxis protein [Selenomonas sp.]|uniref:methyl-accepting chemotaxis protein n=1 Tax=Selenomonas sp. TaxID=2053611 RepID=UPI0025D02B43|nr:methyl-accepting chemotaxis protein [Selenomonas sp.]MCI6232261.1 methyl-accepting chemotaxis protein [Selenomonas sp.]
MNGVKNIKIGAKLVALIVFMGILMFGSVFLSGSTIENINNSYQRIDKYDTQAALDAVRAGKAFSEARGSLTRYLFRVDPAERQQIANEMAAQDKKIDEEIAAIQPVIESDAAKAALEKLQKDLSAYRTARTALMQAQTAPGAPVDNLPQLKPVHDLGADLSSDFDKIAEIGTKGAAQETSTLGGKITSDRVVMMTGSIIVIVIAILIGLWLARMISQRLTRLQQRADAIADGDLSQPVQVLNDDEIGQLAAALEQMRQNLQQSMSEIHMAADQVAAGARNVSDASVSLSQGAAEQASSVEELSSSISEISSQTASNAENADQAHELTEKARQQAEVGDGDMKEMLQAMDAINVSSTNISKIIKVIDEIAFQTNILALNAAVEAARAGQHGKGFAVVAEEVRNLAARSAKAAKETTDMIEDSIEKVENGRAIATKTADALQAIMSNVAEVTDIVGSIAKASNEQKLALAQIDQGVTQVSQVVQSNSATSEEAASASEELSAQAERLKETAGRFRFDSTMHFDRPPQARPAIKKPQLPPAAAKKRPAKIALTEEEGFGKY